MHRKIECRPFHHLAVDLLKETQSEDAIKMIALLIGNFPIPAVSHRYGVFTALHRAIERNNFLLLSSGSTLITATKALVKEPFKSSAIKSWQISSILKMDAPEPRSLSFVEAFGLMMESIIAYNDEAFVTAAQIAGSVELCGDDQDDQRRRLYNMIAGQIGFRGLTGTRCGNTLLTAVCSLLPQDPERIANDFKIDKHRIRAMLSKLAHEPNGDVRDLHLNVAHVGAEQHVSA